MTTAVQEHVPAPAWLPAIGLAVTQVGAFLAALLIVVYDPGPSRPWPIVLALGVFAAQVYLASLVAAWGPWRLWPRLAGSASAVVAGNLVAFAFATQGRINPRELLDALTFVLLTWAANQVPLWVLRPVLGVRVVRVGELSDAATSRPTQFRIRQLMALTLLVALTLGIGRWLFPASAWASWGQQLRSEWLLMAVFLTALTLVGVTTAATALHERFWLIGMGVSALSSVLVAAGLYEVMEGLNIGPASDHLPFAVLMIVIYAWLQASLLLARWSGYRLVTAARLTPPARSV